MKYIFLICLVAFFGSPVFSDAENSKKLFLENRNDSGEWILNNVKFIIIENEILDDINAPIIFSQQVKNRFSEDKELVDFYNKNLEILFDIKKRRIKELQKLKKMISEGSFVYKVYYFTDSKSYSEGFVILGANGAILHLEWLMGEGP